MLKQQLSFPAINCAWTWNDNVSC